MGIEVVPYFGSRLSYSFITPNVYGAFVFGRPAAPASPALEELHEQLILSIMVMGTLNAVTAIARAQTEAMVGTRYTIAQREALVEDAIQIRDFHPRSEKDIIAKEEAIKTWEGRLAALPKAIQKEVLGRLRELTPHIKLMSLNVDEETASPQEQEEAGSAGFTFPDAQSSFNGGAALGGPTISFGGKTFSVAGLASQPPGAIPGVDIAPAFTAENGQISVPDGYSGPGSAPGATGDAP
jgi:hypothetical protein